jgi:hypothetical protein
MQRVEIRNAIDPKDDRFAVDHKLTDTVFQSGLTDPREAARPVIAAAGDQPHTVPVALNANAVAVVLDLVQPVGAGRDRERFCESLKLLGVTWG